MSNIPERFIAVSGAIITVVSFPTSSGPLLIGGFLLFLLGLSLLETVGTYSDNDQPEPLVNTFFEDFPHPLVPAAKVIDLPTPQASVYD